jgi:prephenate dehydratase
LNTKPDTIALLGPKGATFSFRAANVATKLLKIVPSFDWDSSFIEVDRNEDILSRLLDGSAKYGIIAAETEVRGRINESLETFARLIEKYHNGDCPIKIVGAIRMPLSFALMVKKGVKRKDIRIVRAHPQGIAACAKNIARACWEVETLTSNGIAIESLHLGDGHEAALGPAGAARLYDLDILDETFEDAPAVTTFFVLGPEMRTAHPSNRTLIVFRLLDGPMAFVNAIMPFGQVGLNLTYVHSIHSGKRQYDFIAEVDSPYDKLPDLLKLALPMFKRVTLRSIVFGPFPVLDAE